MVGDVITLSVYQPISRLYQNSFAFTDQPSYGRISHNEEISCLHVKNLLSEEAIGLEGTGIVCQLQTVLKNKPDK